jgi:hypothetical protein
MTRVVAALFTVFATATAWADPVVLRPADFALDIDEFNAADIEPFWQGIPNNRAWNFIVHNAPPFSCPDADFEPTYWFCWRTW